MDFGTSVSKLPFVGPVYARRLNRLGIKTIKDLLYYFPYRYDDFRKVSKIRGLKPGATLTIRGRVLSIKNEYTKKGKVLQNATVEDETGKLDVVWFNQRFLVRTIKEGTVLSLSGKIDWFGKKLVLQSPEYEILKDLHSETIHTGRLVPVYSETARLSSKWLRNRIKQILPQVKIAEFLPNEILGKFSLPKLEKALCDIHFPNTPEDQKTARERFAFEELFLIHLSVLGRKKDWSAKRAFQKITIPGEITAEFISKLSYELTGAQRRSIKELSEDLSKTTPMNRLLEGDVGSGKTVVAAIGAFTAFKNGLQTAIMAPTQILATQHYHTLKNLLESYDVKIELIISGSPTTSEVKRTSHLRGVKPDVIVGTHALLHTRAKSLLDKLALVVIDEQHKFGVEQRAKLLGNSESFPHLLTMTATPIPRTIALTLYGDLDLSVLDEMPPGRMKITTWLVPQQKREGAYNWIREQILKGSQAFIVCPIIEESEHETMQTVKAATVEFERLKKVVFPELKLGLLHGRLKAKEKDEVVNKFRAGEYQILVSTPVVEVGIDIPNTTIMVIEAADRFGLAQLHQLRGRVGRGEKKSYCLLFTESKSEKVLGRVKAMEEAKTGPELAELDLRLRGPGEIFGTAQHGFPEMRVASFSDLPLIHKTREAAEMIFPKLDQYRTLASHLKTHLVVPN